MRTVSVCFLIFICPFVMKGQPPVPSETTGMTNATINEKGELKVIPGAKSSERDFDFFYGSWNVKGKTQKQTAQFQRMDIVRRKIEMLRDDRRLC